MENKTIYFLNIEGNCYIFKESLTGILDFEKLIKDEEKDSWLDENIDYLKNKKKFYPDLSVMISGVIYNRFQLKYSPYIEMFSKTENQDYENIKVISNIILVLYYLSFGYGGGIGAVLSDFSYENTVMFTLAKYFAADLRPDIFFIPYYYSFRNDKSNILERILENKAIDIKDDFSRELIRLYSFAKNDINVNNLADFDKFTGKYYEDKVVIRNESLLLPIVGIGYYNFNDYLNNFIREKNRKVFIKDEYKKINEDFKDTINSYKIFLQYEPFNIYDKNAVAVCLLGENNFAEKIGYLRRDFARILNPIFKRGFSMKGEIAIITGSEGFDKEIIINVKRDCGV